MEHTRTGAPLTIVPGLTSNILIGVSFLIGTSSFILGLRIQSASKTITPIDNGVQTGGPTLSLSPSTTITKYYELLILALVFPAIVINIYGILAVASNLYFGRCPLLNTTFCSFHSDRGYFVSCQKLH